MNATPGGCELCGSPWMSQLVNVINPDGSIGTRSQVVCSNSSCPNHTKPR